MKQHRPSFTAQVVAASRLAMAAPAVGLLREDPLTRALLHPALRLVADAMHTPLAPLLWRGLEALVGSMPHIGGRTLFFDQALDDALAAGIDQVVLLGAGFDARATRGSDARFFEVDHPATQRAKRALLDEIGFDATNIRFCVCDFERDRVGEVLRAAELDQTRPSFFLWEGVTMYLEPEIIAATFAELAGVAAPGSVLCFDATRPTPPAQVTAMMKARRWLVTRAGEPFRARLEPAHMQELLRHSGWQPVETHTVGELHARYFTGTCLHPPTVAMNYVVRAVIPAAR